MAIGCFCFSYSEEDILKDVDQNGRSTIVEKIMEAQKFGGCHGAVKNPQGR